ncbi:MAG TPA: hypothetical protein VMZ53_17910 [Kofleriaceae bacterium]|nr:hypothetical protein [Kofleriaceae bacterium]
MRIALLLLFVPTLAFGQPAEDPPVEPSTPTEEAPPPSAPGEPPPTSAQPAPVVTLDETVAPSPPIEITPLVATAVEPIVPAIAPPAPLVMPELVARNRITISPMVSSILLVNLAMLAVGGTYTDPRLGGLELYGDVKVRAGGVVAIGGSSENEGAGPALGNIRVGARYHVRTGRFRIAPAMWAWLPTSNAEPYNHDAWEGMAGMMDNRGFGRGAGALGVGINAGYFGERRFVQVEAGAAIVSDRGPQIDDVFFAVGYGSQVNDRTSFLTEFRVEAVPEGGRMYGPAIGFGRRDGQATMWRMRFHPLIFPGGELPGLAIGVDVVHRFQ